MPSPNQMPSPNPRVNGLVARRVLIDGDVQGVFFRDTCRRIAVGSGVAGWVRNRADGRVEAWLEGASEPVDRLVEWCRQGPAGAQVNGVEVTHEEPSGETGFRIR